MSLLTEIPSPLDRFGRWLAARKLNAIIAGVFAVAAIAAVTTLAATSGGFVHKNCPAPVNKWLFSQGWKNNRTYTCKVKLSAHTHDALPGSVAENEFRNIRTKAQLGNFLRSGNDKANKLRAFARTRLNDRQFKNWQSGKYFVPVQFKLPAVIKGNTHLDDGRVVFSGGERNVHKGDILFVFTDPGVKKTRTITVKKVVRDKKGKVVRDKKGHKKFRKVQKKVTRVVIASRVVSAGNIRLDCGNVAITAIHPRSKVSFGRLKIVKFEDKNGNKKQDQGEHRLKGFKFRVQGIGVFITNKKGVIILQNLAPRAYTVSEIGPKWKLKVYKPTTKTKLTVPVKNKKTTTVKFGNRKPTPEIQIVKFEDKNGNKKQDKGEKRMKNIAFKVSRVIQNDNDKAEATAARLANDDAVATEDDDEEVLQATGQEDTDFGKVVVTLVPTDNLVHIGTFHTNKTGEISRKLTPGTYRIEEVMTDGKFHATTGRFRTVTVKQQKKVVRFGNKAVTTAQIPAPLTTPVGAATPGPTTAPTSTPTMTPTPGPSTTPTPGPSTTPTPGPTTPATPKTPETPGPEIEGKGSLPKTGAAETGSILSIAALAAIYYLRRYYIEHPAPKRKK